MADITDILTTLKNIVVALNNQNATATAVPFASGRLTSPNVSASAVVVLGSGRLASFSVTVAGSAPGAVHDATTVAGVSAANLIVTIPNTLGFALAGVNFTKGLVVVPGTSQTVNLTYSTG